MDEVIEMVRLAADLPPSAAFLAGYTLNPAQARFLACDERFSFYVGGVGAGKSFAGALKAIAWMLDHPGSLGVIGAPTYPMLRDATQRTVFELLESLPESLRRQFNKSEQRLLLENGSEVLFRSLEEPDRMRGLNLAWFWLDEAPLCTYYSWQMLKARLRQPGYPWQGWATGTPRGRDGFAYDFELRPRPHHALFRASTLENAAHLPPEYVEDLGYSGALYDQDVLGLFTAFEGLVYTFEADDQGHLREHPVVLEWLTETTSNTEDAENTAGRGEETSIAQGGHEGHEGQRDGKGWDGQRRPDAGAVFPFSPLRHSAPNPAYPEVNHGPFADVLGGVDWGYTNPTAAVVFGLDGDDRAWQLDEWYQRRAPLDEVVLPALCELTRRWGIKYWYCGPDEPEHIAQLRVALSRAHLSCMVIPGNNAVSAGIQTITRALARRGDGTRGLYVSPRCTYTIAEYGSYQYPMEDTQSPLGMPGGPRPAGMGAEASEVPIKANDHAMDATRYALHTHLTGKRKFDAYLADMRRGIELRRLPPQDW